MAEPIPVTAAIAPACPRCGTAASRVLARSPVEGAWTMHGCPVCFYSWRDTEPPEMSTREGIAPGFRVDPATIAQGRVMPAIPPRRGKAR